ncbi:MAG: FAD-binding protein [Desulfobacterales bacterium]|nr:FAD-binding protein [Desulfobacterales bacterium]
MREIPKEIDRAVSTDVLVIGGGGAGAGAAMAAARRGSRVLVAAKGRLGRSGSTPLSSAVVAMDGESARKMGQRRADPSLTPDRWFEQIVGHGFFLSEQPLAQLYVEQAPARVAELLGWGRRAGQPFFFGAGGSWITTGRAIGRSLCQGMRESPPIDLLEDVMICELICSRGRISGALGIDIYSGELVYVACRAVVIATGGFHPFSFKCTAGDNTGDGIAMAFRAGAAVADMEFLLFCPGAILSPRAHRGSILPMFLYGTGQIRPEIVDAQGSDLIAPLPAEVRRLARDPAWFKLVHALIWSETLAAGRGTSAGGLFFDFRRYSSWRYFKGLLLTFMVFKKFYGRRFHYQHRSVRDLFDSIRRRGRWEVGLCCEYSLGGVVVDAGMQTAAAGVFAAGEAASGTFGATRTSRALTEMLVQGFVAGESAAAWSKGVDAPAPAAERIEQACRKVLAPLTRSGGTSPGPVLETIEAIADAALGVRRSAGALEKGLARAAALRREILPRLAVQSPNRRYNLEWIQALQLENQLFCLEAALRAALRRSESRGQHIRSDFPQVDNGRWLRRLHFENRGGKPALRPRQPSFCCLSPPQRDFPGVLDYALDRRRQETGRLN